MIRKDKSGVVVLCIYVDDVLLTGDDEAVKQAIKDIKTIFDIRKEGKLSDYLGCILNFDRKDEATMHQPHIIKKLCDNFKT